MASKKIVIVGGGLGGALAAKLLQGVGDVTLIDSKEYFEIRWAALRGYVEPSVAEKIVIAHKDYLTKATVKVGKVVGATSAEVKLEDGTSVPYDYLIIATGSKADGFTTVQERLAAYEELNKKLKAANSVLIVGGGPVGVEMAGELVTDYPDKKVTIVHSGSRLIEFLKETASRKALKWLESKNVQVIFGDRVELNGDHQTSGVFKTKKGVDIPADHLFMAIGSRPDSAWLKDSFADMLDADGRVKVDEHLNMVGHANIYAIGDITNIPEAKQGYFAQIHARQTAANLTKQLANANVKGLKTYKAGPNVGLVSLGRKNGLAQLPFGTFTGFLPTSIKSKDLFIPKVRGELGLPK
eukprot:jgi/Mesen1/9638/ME000669S09073